MKSILGRFTANRAPEPREPVLIGVCGKHPSEEDHFSDYPVGAVRMPDIARQIYTEGIKGNFESGAWKQLPADKRVAAFDHVFLAGSGGDVVIGRMSPSSDRVGRADYPIIYCAELQSGSLGRAAEIVLAELRQLEERSRAATSRETIRGEMSASQEKLRAALSTSADGAAPADGLIDCAELGPQRVGLYRVLYRIDSEASGYIRANASNSRMGGNLTPTLHLRVPLCADSPATGLQQWGTFLRALLGDGVQLALFMPVAQKWVDVVIGPELAEQVYFLMSAGETMVTEVPYPVDGTFAARAEKWISTSRASAAKPPAGNAPQATIRPPPLPKSSAEA
jgi:hypothetical protein